MELQSKTPIHPYKVQVQLMNMISLKS